MTLLIDIRQPDWMLDEELRDILAPLLPGVPIRCWTEAPRFEDVTMAAVVTLNEGLLRAAPNLQLIQKLGAGVEGILSNPDLPDNMRVARLAATSSTQEIVDYCLAYVLHFQRNVAYHLNNNIHAQWQTRPPRQNHKTEIAILGLGNIGTLIARTFAGLGFKVSGWSRSQKSIDKVRCTSGEAGLNEVLGSADYVISILPSTPQTRNLLDSADFRAMKSDAILINVGRGDVLVDQDLLAALDGDEIAGAVLDVFRGEPLPADHAFWGHDRIIVTPHVSGWHLDDAFLDVAENYKRLTAGNPLLYEVDRARGY